MHKTEKEKVVADLVERLRSTESLIVADYRGLTNAQLVELRAKLRASGARLKVVKNTLTRRAAEEVGNESLLVLLEGPTAIAFVEAEGDPVAVAKALADTAKDTKVLELRGGLLSGRSITGAEVEELAKLPAPEVVKSQLVGVIVAPLTQLAAIVAAPLRDLVGLSMRGSHSSRRAATRRPPRRPPLRTQRPRSRRRARRFPPPTRPSQRRRRRLPPASWSLAGDVAARHHREHERGLRRGRSAGAKPRTSTQETRRSRRWQPTPPRCSRRSAR